MDSREIFGGAVAGAPIGAIATGNITDASWQPMDGRVLLKADYPNLDTSKLVTFDGQSVVTGATLAALVYSVTWVSGTTWYAASTSSTAAYKSTDNGVTWTACVLPQSGATHTVNVINGMWFCVPRTTVASTIYTSPDGVTWTARTSGIPAGHRFSGVGYVNGLYVLVPYYSSGSTLQSAYSADGVTWITSSIRAGYSAPWTGQGDQTYIKRVAQAPSTGVLFSQLSDGAGSSLYSHSTVDGKTWSTTYYAAWNGAGSSNVTVNPAIGVSAEDVHGNLRAGSYVYFGAGQYDVGFMGLAVPYSPFPGFNVAVSAIGLISEDHGASLHRVEAALVGSGYNSYDFSGSRVLGISSSGVVSYLDASPTKFRLGRFPSTQWRTPQKLWMKVA